LNDRRIRYVRTTGQLSMADNWERALVDRMPTAACFSYGLVLNDFARLQEALPERLGPYRIDRAQYYVGCMQDYWRMLRRGVDPLADLDILLHGLDSESSEVRLRVQSASLHQKVTAHRARVSATVARAGAQEAAGGPVPPAVPYIRPEQFGNDRQFATVFDALAWERAREKTSAAEGFLDAIVET
jgi:hypothetical protein